MNTPTRVHKRLKAIPPISVVGTKTTAGKQTASLGFM